MDVATRPPGPPEVSIASMTKAASSAESRNTLRHIMKDTRLASGRQTKFYLRMSQAWMDGLRDKGLWQHVDWISVKSRSEESSSSDDPGPSDCRASFIH